MANREPKRKVTSEVVWREARELVWAHRTQLTVGLCLMLVNRLAGLVLPASSKFLIDKVLPQQRSDLLWELALAVGLATLVQASTSFGLSQVMSIAAQRAITELRKAVQAHVLRLPVTYFDSTKTGALISRIMSDAETVGRPDVLRGQCELADADYARPGDAEERIGADEIVVDVDAVPRQVGERAAQTVDRSRAVTAAGVDSGLQACERQRISPVERQVVDLA